MGSSHYFPIILFRPDPTHLKPNRNMLMQSATDMWDILHFNSTRSTPLYLYIQTSYILCIMEMAPLMCLATYLISACTNYKLLHMHTLVGRL